MGLRLATGFGGLKPTHSLAPVTTYKSGMLQIVSIRDQVHAGTSDEGWVIHTDGSLRYRGRIVVPQLAKLREEIL